MSVWYKTIWDSKPNLGRIKTYTSGCLKNQNKCWNNTTSPLLSLSKNDVFTLRSKRSIVIPAANTGKDRTSKKTVVKNAQTNTGRL